MKEKGSSFNKLLILIILGMAAFFYYDKYIKVEKPTDRLPKQEPPLNDDVIVKDSDYTNFLEKGDFKGVVNTLSAKKILTPTEKLHLGIAYKETKNLSKADTILEELFIDKSASIDNRANARVIQTLIHFDSDIKKSMEIFNSLIMELDAQNLPVIELELGDKLWEKFGSKINTYWYEMYFAYGLAYNALQEENPRFAEVEARLQKLSHYIYFTNSDIKNMKSHVIQSGDRIITIAKQHDVNKELIELTNGLTASSIIREGNKIKIVNGVGSVRVNKKKHTLLLFLNGIFVKRYKIGLGKENRTPEGIFKVNASGKIIRPPWYNKATGQELEYTDGGTNGNPLGTHWIPFSDGSGIGIHGTWVPSSIGKDESNGCVRMLNEEVKEVYAFMREGSTVEIE